jgi:hypothetical protein
MKEVFSQVWSSVAVLPQEDGYAPFNASLPPAPTGLTASLNFADIQLQWTAVSGATSYKVYRGTSSGAETLLASGVLTNSYLDVAPADFATYYYKVAATNISGTGAQSSEISQAAPIQSVSGKLLWIDAQKQGGTNNTAVTAVTDYSGNGNNATGFVSAWPKYFTSGIAGIPALDYALGSAVFPHIFPNTTQNYTIACVILAHSVSSNGMISAGADSTGHTLRIISGTDVRVRNNGTAYDFNPTTGGNPGTLATETPYLFVLTNNATLGLMNLFINGKWVAQISTSGTSSDNNQFVLGSDASGNNQWNGRTGSLLLLDHCATPQEMTAIHAGWATQYSSAFAATTHNLGFDGASNVDDGGFLYQVAAGLVGHYTLQDASQSGANVETNTSSLPTLLFPFYNGFAKGNLCVFQGGANDIRNGDSSATLQTDFTNFVAKCRNGGWVVNLLTIQKSDFSTTVGQGPGDTIRDTVNTWIKGNNSGADYVTDFTTDVHIGTDGTPTDATYWVIASPTVHWTATGAGLAASYVWPVIQNYFLVPVYLYQDTFPGGSGAALPAAWTTATGSFQQNGDGTISPTTTSLSVATVDTGVVNHTAATMVKTTDSSLVPGVVVRSDGTNNYWTVVYSATTTVGIYEVTAGTAVLKASGTAINYTTNGLLRLEATADASGIHSFVNGVAIVSFSSTDFNTNTKAGVRNNTASDATYQNFFSTDPTKV